MKKIYQSIVAILLFFISQSCFAQQIGSALNQITTNDTTKASQSEDLIRTANNLPKPQAKFPAGQSGFPSMQHF